MIAIIDYDAGNIKSVERALSFLNCEYVISKNPSDLKNAEKVIFPGVGEAKYAMEQLKKTGYESFLKDFAESGKPLLGICLGSQIIFDYSEEGNVDCLGIFDSRVRKFEADPSAGVKVPHMGWNELTLVNPAPITASLKSGDHVYFVHSYKAIMKDRADLVAVTDYSHAFGNCDFSK